MKALRMQAPHPKSPDDLAPDFLIEAIRNRCRSYGRTKEPVQKLSPDSGDTR